MSNDTSTPSLDLESRITEDLLEQEKWGVGWVRVNDGGDRISETTIIYGSFVQAAYLAARLSSQGISVTDICRWGGS